ncbi:uncharacterized protein LOC103576349 isoform X2 [Microplitis demolitor]|uniref:uncharacterized protein LOC103576349 isoform X2 n=1 Tax=Microplitis demolitor TaxID=69319 RepID=UPI0004CC99FB|nr:uncharacterized protein LOC103576349 isoform X2 [Microplitis demolitor]
MSLKLINKFLILIIMKLILARANFLIETPDWWEINFDTTLFSKIICDAVLINPQLFLAEAECVQKGLNFSDKNIFVNYHHVKSVYVNVTEVNKTKIFYNENLTGNYDRSKRNIAALITEQPVVSLNYAKLSTTAVVLSIDYRCLYTESHLIKLLASKLDKIDLENCFVPVFNGNKIDVSPCRFLADKLFCSYNHTAFREKKLENIKKFVFCSNKEEKLTDLVIGILSEKILDNMMTFNDSEIPSEISIENVCCVQG